MYLTLVAQEAHSAVQKDSLTAVQEPESSLAGMSHGLCPETRPTFASLRAQGLREDNTHSSHQGVDMQDHQNRLVMEEVTDPEELANIHARRARFERNAAWLQAHASEVYTRYRGQCICIAGEELFVADTPEEALALAAAVHPEDDGRLLRYIPREKLARIYAH